MQFDVFHSVGRIDSIEPRLTDTEVFAGFFSQVCLAEKLGFETIWVAESHFSSEVQKRNSNPVIPNYLGEVGINCDSFQLAQQIFARTEKIAFGTAIHNIVGGNGGPLASADRVRSLAFLNQFLDQPREIFVGVAQGRFPYINSPFGIEPRDEAEKVLWPYYKRLIFLEALEIFLRLSQGEVLSSEDTAEYLIEQSLFATEDEFRSCLQRAGLKEPAHYRKRWDFEPLQLVPELSEDAKNHLHFVLGSSDPMARKVGFQYADPDIFNLSFTPPEKLALIHQEMEEFCKMRERPWTRQRLPRTVLIFIDQDAEVARQRADACFTTYIEAMRGTVGFPPKEILMSRALIGNPSMICAQLSDEKKFGFAPNDRLMLWFEFNQADHQSVEQQMQLFAREVMPEFAVK